MKVGIRFSDNDFWNPLNMFFHLFILPTFKEVKGEPGHMVTHLTSSMIVELFNTHMPYCVRYCQWNNSHHNKYYSYQDIYDMQLSEKYFVITEMEVYWDNKIDDYIEDWDSGNNNSEFQWTDGKKVYIS